MESKKLDATALGQAFGIVWGICVLLLTWANWLTHGAAFAPLVHAIDSIYPGYYSGFFGGIWGLIMGFIDGFIGGWLVGVLYNAFAEPRKAAGTTAKPPDEPEE